jgi:hypothetical protein
MKFIRVALFWSIFALGAASNSFAQSKGPSLDGSRPTPSATASPTLPPSAFARPQNMPAPIPLRWKIGILASAFIIGLAGLALAARNWRSWNLFDRQYRFPPVPTVALRLGANKSGGCMATIQFSHRVDPTPED